MVPKNYMFQTFSKGINWYLNLSTQQKIGTALSFLFILFLVQGMAKKEFDKFFSTRSKDCDELAKRFLRASYDYAIENNVDNIKQVSGGSNGIALIYTIDGQGNISSENEKIRAIIRTETGNIHKYLFFFESEPENMPKGFHIKEVNRPYLTSSQIQELKKINSQEHWSTFDAFRANKPLLESSNAITCKINGYRVTEVNNKISWTQGNL